MTAPKIGDVQIDRNGGHWVVVGIHTENGVSTPSVVMVGSIAHAVHAQADPRIATSLNTP